VDRKGGGIVVFHCAVDTVYCIEKLPKWFNRILLKTLSGGRDFKEDIVRMDVLGTPVTYNSGQ